jgi:hypothetical protein
MAVEGISHMVEHLVTADCVISEYQALIALVVLSSACSAMRFEQKSCEILHVPFPLNWDMSIPFACSWPTEPRKPNIDWRAFGLGDGQTQNDQKQTS